MAENVEPTQLLIESNKVDLVLVRTRHGDKLSLVFLYMIEKRTGQTVSANSSIGAFIGTGMVYHRRRSGCWHSRRRPPHSRGDRPARPGKRPELGRQSANL